MTDPTPATPRKHPVRRLLMAIGAIALIALVLLAFLPQILGSKWLYQKLVDRLAVQGFRLQVDSAELGWTRPIALRGIRLEQLDAPESGDAKPNVANKRLDLLSIEAIESNRSLLGYLLHGRDLGQITIRKPQIDVELLENTSNLEKLAKSIEESSLKPKANPGGRPPKIDIALAVEGLSVSVTSPEDAKSKGQDQVLVIPPLDLKATYRSLDGNARVEIEPTTILDSVEITPELVRLGLGRAIPLLAKSAWFDGRVSLHIDATEIPLEHAELLRGRAQLTLHQVRSGPSEPVILNVLDMIAKFRKAEPVHELVFVDGSVVLVSAHDGVIEHQGVQIGLPKIDPRLQINSAGNVGIVNRVLDLGVGIPVPLEMLARRESVQSIGVPQITLPIRGTLDSPYVDWKGLRHDSADLLTLISAALGDEAPGTAAAIGALSGVAEGNADQAIGAAIDLIRELRQKRQERKKSSAGAAASSGVAGNGIPTANDPFLDASAEDTSKSNNTPEDASAPRRPLRDALKNLLNGRDRNP
ncbi:MAG: hypothetical protein ACK5OB_20215 [Pirellula sp.]